MRKIGILAGLVGLAAVSATVASAQGVDRKGFYGDIGANYSAPNQSITNGSFTDKDTQGGIAYVLGLGWGLNDSWRVGLQVDYMKVTDVFKNDEGPGIDGTVMFYTVAGTWYPNPKKDIWVRLNLGYGSDKIEFSGASSTASGFAGGIGVGYDWLLGKEKAFAVTPYISYMDLFKTGDFGGDLSGEGITGKYAAFQIGVTLGYKH